MFCFWENYPTYITYLIQHRPHLPLIQVQCRLNHPCTWIQHLGKCSKNQSTQRLNPPKNRSSSKFWLFHFCTLGDNITGWPWHRENREFGCKFFQTGKTQGIWLQQMEKFSHVWFLRCGIFIVLLFLSFQASPVDIFLGGKGVHCGPKALH